MTIIHENIFMDTLTVEEAEQILEELDQDLKRCLDDFGKIENPTKEQFAMLNLLQDQTAYSKWTLMKYIKEIRQ